MLTHPQISILAINAKDSPELDSFFRYLQSMAHVKLTLEKAPPGDLSPYDVVISADTTGGEEKIKDLEQFAADGGGWLKLVYRSTHPLPEIFGAQPGQIGPAAELRVLFDDPAHPLATRLPDAVYLEGVYHPLALTAEDTELILYADWHYQHFPMLVARKAGEGKVACTTLQAYRHPVFQQILFRIVRYLAGANHDDHTLGIGLLGYAPSVGQIHGLGAQNTPGLELRAACDLSSERLDRAQQDFPHIKTYAATDALAADAGIDLVIIATPPNTHAGLAVQMMGAGKHVVCEKPLALTRRETDAMTEMADKQGVHLSCHQNRRWDVDYLAIQQALREGLIGELFYMETFVGGFHHPCGYWHSHDTVSGGLTYDWGAHYLDWIVSLIPDPIHTVTATRHKRVWHDVTNADQERIQLRFAGGQEAEFMHSDIAALRKPKWYLLGTKGAISGQWQDVVEYEPDPLVYFEQHSIPATEMPPDLTLYRRHPSGQIVTQKLAVPERRHFGFHRNIADHLLSGEPITAPLSDSVQVVAILEAAARSAASGGTAEVLDG
ncbi:MAG: Gfo/Idh/MocA family oxidoreductase [Deltaproteobacteria bacterium]|jgi:predicted dehydrogenase|nr:Gfo/Idh/MocA family oxidoreductase [Deltaproteobacteria bacterium]